MPPAMRHAASFCHRSPASIAGSGQRLHLNQRALSSWRFRAQDDTFFVTPHSASLYRRVRSPQSCQTPATHSNPRSAASRDRSARIARSTAVPQIQGARPMFRKPNRNLAFESLETRQLLAADIALNGDVLTIHGTSHNDQIDVERVDSGMLQVSMNGKQKLF